MVVDGLSAAREVGEPGVGRHAPHHDEMLADPAIGVEDLGDAQVRGGADPAVQRHLPLAGDAAILQRGEVAEAEVDRLLHLVDPLADEEHRSGVGLPNVGVECSRDGGELGHEVGSSGGWTISRWWAGDRFGGPGVVCPSAPRTPRHPAPCPCRDHAGRPVTSRATRSTPRSGSLLGNDDDRARGVRDAPLTDRPEQEPDEPAVAP